MKISLNSKYDGIYYLDDSTLHSTLAAIFPSDTPLQWHHRSGHRSLQKLRQVLPIESIKLSY